MYSRSLVAIVAVLLLLLIGCGSPALTVAPTANATASPTAIAPAATPKASLPPTPGPSPSASVTVRSSTTKDGVTIDDISFAAAGRQNDAYVVRPEVAEPGPSAGVLWFHWLETGAPTSNRTEFLEEARQLAAAGVVSLLVDGTFPWREAPQSIGHDRASLDAELVMLQAAFDLLLAQPAIDPARTAVVGHDFGSMYQSVFFARNPSITALVMLAPTARWADWFLRYWPITDDADAYRAQMADVDPVTALAAANGRPVLLQFASADRFVPLEVATEITAAAGPGGEARNYDGGHELDEQARRDRGAWLAQELGFEWSDAGSAPIEVGEGPIGIAEADGSIWVAVYWDGTVVRIDPATRSVTDTVTVGTGAIGITSAAGSLWVTMHESAQVARIDPATGEVIATIDVGPQPEGIAGDDDAIWVTSEENGEVWRIDPATNEVVDTVAVEREPRHVGLGFGSIWVTNFGSATVTRIDPATNEVIATIDGGFGPEGIVFSDEFVWVANGRDGTVSKIDPGTNTAVDTIVTGAGTEGLVVDYADNVWAAVTGTDEIVNIARSTTEVLARFGVGDQPRRMVFADRQIWVTNTGDGTVSVPVVPIPE